MTANPPSPPSQPVDPLTDDQGVEPETMSPADRLALALGTVPVPAEDQE